MNELSLKRLDALTSMIKNTLHDKELGISSISITFSNGQTATVADKPAKPLVDPVVREQQYNELKLKINEHIRSTYESANQVLATVSHLARATGKTKRDVIYRLRQLVAAGKLELGREEFALTGDIKKLIKFVDITQLQAAEAETKEDDRLIATGEAESIKKRIIDQVSGLEESDMKVLE